MSLEQAEWPYVRAADDAEASTSGDQRSPFAVVPESFPPLAVPTPAGPGALIGATSAAASAPTSSAAPSRAGRACYFLLGAGLLAAWNALITATDYFQTAFPGYHTDRLFTLCYLPLCMGMLAFGIRYPDLPPPPIRIRIGYLGFTAAMAAVPLVDALMVDPHVNKSAGVDGPPSGSAAAAPTSALVAVLLCVAAVGLCDGLCQGALFGEAAQLPPPYTHAVVSGTASSGLLVCLLRLLSKASFEAVAAARQAEDGGDGTVAEADRARQAGLRDGTRLYFALAGVLSLSCLVVYDGVLPRLRSLPRRRSMPQSVSTAESQERHPLLRPLELSKEFGSGGGSCSGGGRGDDAGVRVGDGSCSSRGSGRGRGTSVNGDEGGGDSGRAARWPVAHLPTATAPVPLQLPYASSTVGDDGVWDPVTVTAAAHHEASHKGFADSGVAPATVHRHGGGSGSCCGGCLALSPQLQRCVALSWPLCGSLLVTYTVTLSIFPGFLAEDVHSVLLGDWYPILLITTFNAADLLGKSLPVLEPFLPHRCPPSGRTASTEATDASKDHQQRYQQQLQGQYPDERQPEDRDVPPPTSPFLATADAVSVAKARSGPRRGRMLSLKGLYDSLFAPAMAAALMPLRRPAGLLAASLLRGAVALPVFLVAARWEAPAAVMVVLTAALGVSNGYLTGQVLTMGPTAVLTVHASTPPPSASAVSSTSAPASRPRGRHRKEDPARAPLRSSIESDDGLVEAAPAVAVAVAPAPAAAQLVFRSVSGSASLVASADGAYSNSTGKGYGAPAAMEPANAVLAVGQGLSDSAIGGFCSSSNIAAYTSAPDIQRPGEGRTVLYGDSASGEDRGVAHGGQGPEESGGHHVDAEVVENLLVLSLVAGLNLGAYLGWLWLL